MYLFDGIISKDVIEALTKWYLSLWKFEYSEIDITNINLLYLDLASKAFKDRFLNKLKIPKWHLARYFPDYIKLFGNFFNYSVMKFELAHI